MQNFKNKIKSILKEVDNKNVSVGEARNMIADAVISAEGEEVIELLKKAL